MNKMKMSHNELPAWTLPEGLRFLGLWLRNPARLGAIVPSSRGLAQAMARQIDVRAPGAIVELGGGTGSITAALLRAGAHLENLVVVEREKSLCGLLVERFPGIRVICGDARDLARLLADAGIIEVNAVVSGLPLLSLSKDDGRHIVREAFKVLPRNGLMVQFTYGPQVPVPRRVRRSLGLEADRSAWILQNLPPASVWRLRRIGDARPFRRAA